MRREEMAALRAQGRSIREIARTFGVSERTVQRSLNQPLDEKGLPGADCFRG